jgi:hypothetical protein
MLIPNPRRYDCRAKQQQRYSKKEQSPLTKKTMRMMKEGGEGGGKHPPGEKNKD